MPDWKNLARYWSSVLLVLAIAVTAWPRLAGAQTTTGAPTLAMSPSYPVVRIEDDTNRPPSTGTDTTIALTMTAADCKSSKLKYKFSLTVANWDLTNYIQVFVSRSADCAAEYNTSTARACWRVAKKNVTVSNLTATVEVSPAELLGLEAETPYDGNQRVLTESCDQEPINSGNGRQSLTVYFLAINSSASVAAKVTQAMYYSLKGPAAPEITTLLASDQSLQLKWGALTSSTTELTYEFYCARTDDDAGCKSSILEQFGSTGPSGSTASAGAGNGENTGGSSNTGQGGRSGVAGETVSTQTVYAAGTASTALNGSAGATVFDSGFGGETVSTAVAALEDDADAGQTSIVKGLGDYYCGKQVGKISGEGYTDTKLKNGDSYAVAIAVRDYYGSLGTLSSYQCMTPVQIDTFYESYKRDHGKGGGGFCNLDVRSRRSTLPTAFLGVGLLAWLRRRHRRSRQPSNPNLDHD